MSLPAVSCFLIYGFLDGLYCLQEVMAFDAFFIVQHYVLYTDRSSRTVETAAPKVVDKSEYEAVDVSEH